MRKRVSATNLWVDGFFVPPARLMRSAYRSYYGSWTDSGELPLCEISHDDFIPISAVRFAHCMPEIFSGGPNVSVYSKLMTHYNVVVRFIEARLPRQFVPGVMKDSVLRDAGTS